MPELPEVESVRRSLARRIVGWRVAGVAVRRAEVVRGGGSPAALLVGQTLHRIDRRGKQLALLTAARDIPTGVPPERQPCVCIHLGMTGSLRFYEADEAGGGPAAPPAADPHAHLVWRLESGSGRGLLVFRDPRRFGGVWAFDSPGELLARRWVRLGEDALTITPQAFHAALAGTARPLKAALLDQRLVAGLGNIYVDEALALAGLHPLTPGRALDSRRAAALLTHTRRLLRRAIRAGGSTLRDYVDGSGTRGRFQDLHRVYGRAGQPCRGCGVPLTGFRLAGRATVFCRDCQPLSALHSYEEGMNSSPSS